MTAKSKTKVKKAGGVAGERTGRPARQSGSAPLPLPDGRGSSLGSGLPDGRGSSAAITVAAFQRLIRDRYLKTDAARGTAGTFMWLIEEVGELATALQENAPGKSPTGAERANLEEEFADVLAWLVTLANINGVDLEGALEKYTQPGRVEGVKD